MTRIELIAKLAKNTGIDKVDIQIMVESLLQLIESTMLEGDSIHFKGFGKFANKKRGKKLARNLSNNTAIIIEEHYVPTFKPSKAFVNKVKESVKVKN